MISSCITTRNHHYQSPLIWSSSTGLEPRSKPLFVRRHFFLCVCAGTSSSSSTVFLGTGTANAIQYELVISMQLLPSWPDQTSVCLHNHTNQITSRQSPAANWWVANHQSPITRPAHVRCCLCMLRHTGVYLRGSWARSNNRTRVNPTPAQTQVAHDVGSAAPSPSLARVMVAKQASLDSWYARVIVRTETGTGH